MCWDFKKIIFSVLTVLWMAIIFWFSSAPAEESTDMSLSAGTVVARLLVPGYEQWTVEEQEAFAEKIDHPVRKTAHATEYAVLGMLILGTLWACQAAGNRRFVVAWIATTAYAATDEFHQLFVAGRSGQISDVVLDSVGAAAGILVCFVASYIIRRKTRCCGKKS